MSWAACGGKNRKKTKNFGKIDLYKLKEKYRFTENELLEFKQRFSYLSNAQELLVKEVFRENMGLLGLDSGAFLADRIFAVLDVDKDGSIKLEEYLRYFDILIYGSPEEKYELTFHMIDLDGKGWFNYDEFEDMIRSMLLTWNNLTGSQFNIDNNRKLGSFLEGIFQRFDINNDNQVTLANFKYVVARNPQLLEIFDYFNQGIIDSIQANAELDQRDLVIIDELEHLHNKLNELKEYLGGKNEQLEPVRTSTKIAKTGEFNHLQRPEHTSPISELKTPIVSSLDSKIRRTIFFEAFKNEQDGRDAMKAGRLQSDKANRFAPYHNSNPEQLDFARRFSYQPSAVVKNSDIREDFHPLEGEKNLLERFRSVDHAARPDYNSLNVFTSFQDATFTKNDNIIEGRRKKELDQLIMRGDDQPGGYLYHETPRLKHEFKKDLESKLDFGVPEALDKHSPYESGPVSANSLKSHKEQEYVHLGEVISPGLKKPMLKITSIPLQQKHLDPELENPYLESVVEPPRKQSQKSQNQNLLESIIVTKPNCSIHHHGVHEVDRLNVFSPSETVRSAQQPNALQIQQVSEQLETLASETLKIIEEIRNKKKTNNLSHLQTAEMEAGQTKATAQNIHKVPTKDRKGGNFVSFGHQNWNLVLNMMLGIQTAVKSAIQKPDNFTSKDFNAKHIFELVPKRTSETKSSFKICTFFDYAPSVFYDLRKLYGIRNEDYLKSIGPEHMLGNLIKGNLSSLSELTSTGKSGSFFYYSSDGKYTLKTISRDEYHFLRNLLHSYYTHLVNNPQSLMIKFFGLHKIRFMKKNRTKEKVYFIIMANVFHTFKEIHERYDLKGSTKGRITNNEEDPSVAKKDLNIIINKEKISLPEDIADIFLEIIQKDSVFFEQNNIIDYSLLMGIHKLSPDEIKAGYTQKRTSLHESRIHGREGILSTDGTKLYFFGIIDILTEFNTKKKAEYVVKRVAYGNGISAVPPHQYADRFRKFITSLVEKGKWRE